MLIEDAREKMEHKNSVPILEKALDILEYIGSHPEPVSLPELQRSLGIPQASCYRIVTTLARRNWLEKRGGNRYDIAAGLAAVTAKTRFRLDRYKPLQPAMNHLANTAGFSAKLSVRDGEEFVNVCSAKIASAGAVIFSEPGFRAPLNDPASVGTIFLAAEPPEMQERLIREASREKFHAQLRFFREHGYCFQPGSPKREADYHFDTLSLPVEREGRLLGVVSLLSLPGLLAEAPDAAVDRVRPLLGIIAEML